MLIIESGLDQSSALIPSNAEQKRDCEAGRIGMEEMKE